MIPVSRNPFRLAVWFCLTTPLSIPPAAVAQNNEPQHGLAATYYSHVDFTGRTVRRIDPALDFDWGWHLPVPLENGRDFEDLFSARWEGQIEPKGTDLYTFFVEHDDGVRLWVNKFLILENQAEGFYQDKSIPISLTAGRKYDIKVEYVERWGAAKIKLLWSGRKLPREPLSMEQLYPTGHTPTVETPVITPGGGVFAAKTTVTLTCATPDAVIRYSTDNTPVSAASPVYNGPFEITSTAILRAKAFKEGAPESYETQPILLRVVPANGMRGLNATYLNSTGVVVATRVDPNIDFNWGEGYPHLALDENDWLARWEGWLEPKASDVYQFHLESDDRATLWIANQRVTESRFPNVSMGTMRLEAGKRVPIRVEFVEAGSIARVRLSWSTKSQPQQVIPPSQFYPTGDDVEPPVR